MPPNNGSRSGEHQRQLDPKQGSWRTIDLKTRNFVSEIMSFVLEIMSVVLEMKRFVIEMTDFVQKNAELCI